MLIFGDLTDLCTNIYCKPGCDKKWKGGGGAGGNLISFYFDLGHIIILQNLEFLVYNASIS